MVYPITLTSTSINCLIASMTGFEGDCSLHQVFFRVGLHGFTDFQTRFGRRNPGIAR